jgi:two-component system response regulator AtoC
MSFSSPSFPNLLIVDDDEIIQRLLVFAAQDFGWRPVSAFSGGEALELLNPAIEAVILDYGMPGMNGMDTLLKIRENHPSLPVIMLTGLNDAETAVQALRAGADDYLTKPFELKRLFDVLRQVKGSRKVAEKPVITGRGRLAAKTEMRSSSPHLRRLLGHLAKAAKLDSTILLTGESGTGKTYFARQIHQMSPRADEDFITVSCPALPRELLESELFGHEKGSFTGATSSRAGRFEQASKGTLFLDEIGDLPHELQPKLLNVLQDREFFRVGGSKMLRTGARVIAATNMDLRSLVEQGCFREDLYYRLNIIELSIPPLRERMEDFADLTNAILRTIAKRRDMETWKLTDRAWSAMMEYDWPGNVRQLENVLERATAFAEKNLLHSDDLIHLLETRREAISPGSENAQTMLQIERDRFLQAYQRAGRNKAKTARVLGISERSVYNMLLRYGLK